MLRSISATVPRGTADRIGSLSVSSRAAGPSLPRVPTIDGLRGIAVLCVVFHHSFLSTPSGGIRSLEPILDKVLLQVMPISVDLFFVISGFLITSILDRTRDADHPVRTFYARRALRIIPLFYGFLLFVAMFMRYLPEPIVGTPAAMMWQLLFLSNVPVALQLKGSGAMFTPFWSLAVEQQFYIFWPLLILLLPRRFSIRICLGVMAFTVVARIVLTFIGPVAWAAVLTPGRLDGLAAGSIVALLRRYNPDTLAPWKKVMRIAGVAFVAAQVAVIPLYIWHPRAGFGFWVAVMPCIASVFFAAAVAGLSLRSDTATPKWLVSPVLTSVARCSYGMYAFHVPLIYVLFHLQLAVKQAPVAGYDFPYRITFFILIAGLSYGLGMISWHLYEKRLLKLAPSYRYSGKAKAMAPSLQNAVIPVP
jgi:peptidoglycan/LPS O-acetylase OafA/YrhL